MSRAAANSGRVLVVEDDEGIREMLKYNLTAAGFSVQEASDGASGLRTARTSRPDLVLLDLMLPGMSGFDFCRALRKSSRVPIIIITAKDSEVDKIVGLELGADDYITKPFSIREVLARVHAVLRRAQPDANEPKAIPEHDSIGAFSINRAARRVILDGTDVKLTAREFDLLSYLLAFPGRVHTRDSLLENVWGREFTGERKTVDVHIRWLREKFAGRAPFEIVTVRGIGYRLDRQAAQIDIPDSVKESRPAAAKEGAVSDQVWARIFRRHRVEPGDQPLRSAAIHLRNPGHQRGGACPRPPGRNRGGRAFSRAWCAGNSRRARNRHRAAGGDPERRLRHLGPVRAGPVDPPPHRDPDHRPPELDSISGRHSSADQPVYGGTGARGHDPAHPLGGLPRRDPCGAARPA